MKSMTKKYGKCPYFYLSVYLTTLLWGINVVIMKFVFTELSPLQLAIIRWVIAGIIFLFILLFYPLEKKYKVIHKEDYFYIFSLGLIGVFLQQIFFLIGLNMTSATNSGIITGLTPIFIFLLSVNLLNEKVTLWKIIGIIISFTGIIVLTRDNEISFSSKSFLGDLSTLAAGFIFAIYTVMAKPMLQKYSGFTITAYNTIIGSVFFIIIGLFVYRGVSIEVTNVSFKTWSCIFYSSIFGSIIPLILWFTSLKFLDATKVAVITYFQPIITALGAFLILGEKLTSNIILGGILVLFGVILTEKGDVLIFRVRD